jgi:hypothetical protein
MDGFAESYLKGLDKKLITDTVGNVISPNLNAGMMSANAAIAQARVPRPASARSTTSSTSTTRRPPLTRSRSALSPATRLRTFARS